MASRIRLYALLRKTARRRLDALYWLWGITIAVEGGLLQAIVEWAAMGNGGPSPLRAMLVTAGTTFAMFMTILNAGLRIRWRDTLTTWEQRVELADRMGLPPTEMRSLLRSWGRHTGHDW